MCVDEGYPSASSLDPRVRGRRVKIPRCWRVYASGDVEAKALRDGGSDVKLRLIALFSVVLL
jgi:hypothetical protein